MLEEFGVRVEVANNGLEAIEWLQQATFDCVLMDVRMPEMDGIEATQRIRANPLLRDLPIIPMTANARTEDRDECLAAGMTDFISKPVEPALFFRILLKYLRAPVAREVQPVDPEKNVEIVPADNSCAQPGAAVDMASLLALGRNNPEKIRRLAKIFLASTGEGVEQILAAQAAGDHAVLAQVGHRLKSSTRSVGAIHLAELMSELESAAKAGDAQQSARVA